VAYLHANSGKAHRFRAINVWEEHSGIKTSKTVKGKETLEGAEECLGGNRRLVGGGVYATSGPAAPMRKGERKKESIWGEED